MLDLFPDDSLTPRIGDVVGKHRSTERELALSQARADAEEKIARHGGIDAWPSLPLAANQFTACTCGCARLAHRMIGTDRANCTTCTTCRLFTANWPPANLAKRRAL